MKMLLNELGYEVVEAMSCLAGLNKLNDELFALVITDVRTSEPNEGGPTGFEVIALVRMQNAKTKVILSANALSTGDMESCFLKPPDGFLQKPFEPNYFRTLVRAFMQD